MASERQSHQQHSCDSGPITEQPRGKKGLPKKADSDSDSWEFLHIEGSVSETEEAQDQKNFMDKGTSKLSQEQCDGETDELSSQKVNKKEDDQSSDSASFHSMTSDPLGTPSDSSPTNEQKELSSDPNSLETLVKLLKKEEKRSKRLQKEREKWYENCARAIEAEKEKARALEAMKVKAEKAKKKAASIQEHSTTQSQRILLLQNEAKEKDANAFGLQKELREMEGKLQILEAEREEHYLKYQSCEKTFTSLRAEVKKLTNDNATLNDRLKKFGGLQNESRELNTKLIELQHHLEKEQEQLKKVSAERDELKSSLELTQAQAKIYEEDFLTERKDRTRAFAEREKEGERYCEEIERLKEQLTSHKGNLSAVETIHLARQKELMQAMEELKKCQEEVQAKTSQVKQYKKQHDGLVSKVAQLEKDKKQQAESIEQLRKEIEQLSRKPKVLIQANDAEVKALHTKLRKETERADHYRAKSKERKGKIAELAKLIAHLPKLEGGKKKEKKKDKEHRINSPVSESDRSRLFQNLEEENQELHTKIEALKNVIGLLNKDTPVGSDEEEDGSVSPPHHYDEILSLPSSPAGPRQSVVKAPKKQATAIVKTLKKEADSERRSKSFSGSLSKPKKNHKDRQLPISPQTLPTPAAPPTSVSGPSSIPAPNPSAGQYVNVPKDQKQVDEQHADYVNQSRVQAMIEQSQKAKHLPPSFSPPDNSSLPAPIVMYTDDPVPPPSPGQECLSIPSSGALGAGGLGYEMNVERRGSAPAWIQGQNPHYLHEQQHQLHQYNQASHTGPPGQLPPATQPPLCPNPATQPPHPPNPASQGAAGPKTSQPVMKQGARESSAVEKERMTREEEERLRGGGDILATGIDTAMHAIVENVMEEQGEGGMAEVDREVTGTPFDPNLTCIICQKMFRIGEIQLYRNHTANCSGTLV